MSDVKGRAPSLLGADVMGRGAQWKFLSEAIESATDSGHAVWLCGEPGIGKTVLLEQAGEFAVSRGLRLLRVNAAEGEKDLPFAALHQLMWPLLEEVRELPPAGRAALERALGVGSGDVAGPYTVSAATLDLLAAASQRRPLALLIDDLHWIDASSAEVLHFLQRRLAALPIVMLATVGEHAVAALDCTGVRILDVEPLTDESAERLLREVHPELSRAARCRILQEAAGNPLALAELPAQLGEPQRTGQLPLPEHLPLGESLGRMFAQRVAALSPAVQFILLLCALAGREGQSLHLVAAAARAAGVDAVDEDLAVAEESGLILVDEPTPRVRFRHPLVRSSLVEAAAGAELRRAHAALAQALPTGDLRQVTHWAAATVVPDETVASALDEAAARTQSQGGDTDAARLFARAAGLSGDAAGRGRRLVAAAFAAATGGPLDLASQLLQQAVGHGVPPESRNKLDVTRALVRLHTDGDFGPAIESLPAVLDGLSDAEAAEIRIPSLFMLFLAAGYTADPHVCEALAARLSGATDFARLAHDVWNDPARHAQGGHERFEAALRGFSEDDGVAEVWLLVWCALGLDIVGDHAPLLRRLAHRHSYATQAFIGAVSAYDDYLRGRWDRCVERARQGAAASRARGFHFIERVHQYREGYVTAARGQQQAVDDLVAAMRPWAVDRGLTFIVHRLRAMQGMCALALGDYETAYTHASSITPPGALPSDVTQFHLVFLDLVESAVHTGRSEEARRHVAAGRAAGMERISPHHGFVLLASEALASEDVDAACEAVYASANASQWPFELARVRLYHGAWLRRHGRRSEARGQLVAAGRVFAGLKADPWAHRARQELRVCDEAKPAGVASGTLEDLTPQELRIAELVAEGLTNRDIGTRLHLSPRTVASHLYKIYPKLGIAGRAAVGRALGRLEGP